PGAQEFDPHTGGIQLREPAAPITAGVCTSLSLSLGTRTRDGSRRAAHVLIVTTVVVPPAHEGGRVVEVAVVDMVEGRVRELSASAGGAGALGRDDAKTRDQGKTQQKGKQSTLHGVPPCRFSR